MNKTAFCGVAFIVFPIPKSLAFWARDLGMGMPKTLWPVRVSCLWGRRVHFLGRILFGSFLLYDKRNEKLDALMFQPGAHMGSCSAQEPHCVLSLISKWKGKPNTGWVRACVGGKGYGLYGKAPPEKSGEVCATQ